MKAKANLEQCIDPRILVFKIIRGNQIDTGTFIEKVIPNFMIISGIKSTELRRDGILIIKLFTKENNDNDFKYNLYKFLKTLFHEKLQLNYIDGNGDSKMI